ncbi:MAG: hypothetical protein WAK10_06975 [Methanoregula sp.]
MPICSSQTVSYASHEFIMPCHVDALSVFFLLSALIEPSTEK